MPIMPYIYYIYYHYANDTTTLHIITPTEATKLATMQYNLYIYAFFLNVVRPKVFKSLTKGFQYLKPLNGIENILQGDKILCNQYAE